MSKALVKFIRRDSFDMLAFGWVTGVLNNIPSCTVHQALISFYSFYGLDAVGSEFPNIESMKMTYQRMRKEFFDSQKNGE